MRISRIAAPPPQEPDDPVDQAVRATLEEHDLVAFMTVQYSGVFNMLTDASNACQAAGLTADRYRQVMHDYSRLTHDHPGASTRAREALSAYQPRDNSLIEQLLRLRKAVKRATSGA